MSVGTNDAITATTGADGSTTIWSNATGTMIDYTAAEWTAFEAGVADHEFDPVPA